MEYNNKKWKSFHPFPFGSIFSLLKVMYANPRFHKRLNSPQPHSPPSPPTHGHGFPSLLFLAHPPQSNLYSGVPGQPGTSVRRKGGRLGSVEQKSPPPPVPGQGQRISAKIPSKGKQTGTGGDDDSLLCPLLSAHPFSYALLSVLPLSIFITYNQARK